MACILHIETSTTLCSVAVSENSQNIYHEEERPEAGGRPTSAEHLGSLVDRAMSFADSHAIPLDAVAVSSGPGSYTGLRIGVSMAKGICYGLQIPLISVPTLELICVPALLREEVPEGALLCPMIDARRMEVYTAVYDRGLRTVREVQANVVDENTFAAVLDSQPVYFLGNGAAKCMDIIRHTNAHLIPDAEPLAKYMHPLAERRLLEGKVEDTAYFEPFYLKDYVAARPRKLL